MSPSGLSHAWRSRIREILKSEIVGFVAALAIVGAFWGMWYWIGVYAHLPHG